MESAAGTAVPWAQVGHLELAAKASSSFNNFGDDNYIELPSDLEISGDLKVMETSAAAVVSVAKVGHQQVVAIAGSSFNDIGDGND